MDVFLAYCKKQLNKQRSFLLLIILLFLFILYLLWGPKVINYMKGPENVYNIFFHEAIENHNFFSISNLENRYAEIELNSIDAGFADTVKGRDTTGIYYLHPINSSQYMIIYADKSEINNMEGLYYNTLEEGVENVTLSGGFVQITDDVKDYAYTYLHETNPNMYTSQENMDEVLLPFVFVSNHLGSSSLIFIKASAYIFFALLCISVLLLIANYKYVSISSTIKSIQKLSEENQKKIDKEFKNSIKVYNYAIGKNIFFYQHEFQYTVFDYQDIIWMYQKKSKFPVISTYELWVYFKDGSRKRLRLGNNKKNATKIMNKIHHGNKEMLMGYQIQLYDKYKMSKEEFLKTVNMMKDTKKGEKHEKV